jgi:UDP-N-acetyl-D-galactosamine dehydrogenase
VPSPRIAVIGLGYVGLPLAAALARHYDVVGFDISDSRVAELAGAHDRTGEIDAKTLRSLSLRLTTDTAALKGCDIFIITVPTPVDRDNRPDLGAVIAACRTVGAALGRGAIVVLESTVYPGVTEEICGPELAKASGMKCGADFFLGYSPERINPGDREHTVERITKVVAGQTPEVTARLAEIYGRVTSGGVFRAHDIKTAEAAKVIENAQRDINIAFMNEVTTIFNRLGLSIHDVLDASRTKWNFLPFTPGLVGGHCIGVDPYYLSTLAERLGHHPQIILAGRRTNDAMSHYIAGAVAQQIARRRPLEGARVLVLGLTFKENVPDLRNSKVVDIVKALAAQGCKVEVYDPLADRGEARTEFGVDLLGALDGLEPYDAVIGAVPHEAFKQLPPAKLASLIAPSGLLADIKGIWRTVELAPHVRRWQL